MKLIWISLKERYNSILEIENKLNSNEMAKTNLNKSGYETYVKRCIKWFIRLRLDIVAKWDMQVLKRKEIGFGSKR